MSESNGAQRTVGKSGRNRLVQGTTKKAFNHGDIIAHVTQEFLLIPEVNVIEALQNGLQLISGVEGFQPVGAYHVLNLLLQSHL